MDAEPEHEGPTINGRAIASEDLLASWCDAAKIKYNDQNSAGFIEIARALNHALLMSPCWNAEAEPIRRRGPHWAPKPIRGRGRPMRRDNNLASNLRKIAVTTFPRAHKQNLDTFIELAMRWLGVNKTNEKTLARASRRRSRASTE